MATTLFVERFLVNPSPAPDAEAAYDESRGYAVTRDGTPAVTLFGLGETTTITEIKGEQTDSDEEADVQTYTFVRAEGTDVSLGSTETFTKIQNEASDAPSAFADTETFTRVRPTEQSDECWATGTMTKTGVVEPRDADSD